MDSNFQNSQLQIVIDGQFIATKLLAKLASRIKASSLKPVLNIIVDPNNQVSMGYVALKKERASEIGLEVVIHELKSTDTTESVTDLIKGLSREASAGGIIVQLPLAQNYDTTKIVQSIPVIKDVDVLNRQEKHPYVQPVAAAVKTALESIGKNEQLLKQLPSEKIHVVGRGFLVGEPVIAWLQGLGINTVSYGLGDDLSNLKSAEIIISGTGSAHLIKPEHLSVGVVLIDAGTTSDSGELLGDIDPKSFELASFYTPVPGGIGPLTLVKLFENVVIMSENDSK